MYSSVDSVQALCSVLGFLRKLFICSFPLRPRTGLRKSSSLPREGPEQSSYFSYGTVLSTGVLRRVSYFQSCHFAFWISGGFGYIGYLSVGATVLETERIMAVGQG